MKPLALVVAVMFAVRAAALAEPAVVSCPASTPTTASVPYNPFGVTVPWVKTSAPGIDVYAALTNSLDAATQERLLAQAEGRGTGTLALFLIDVSAPRGFPKLAGRGTGTAGAFTWPFSPHDKGSEQNGHRYYWVSLTLSSGCWDVSAQLNETTTPAVVLLAP